MDVLYEVRRGAAIRSVVALLAAGTALLVYFLMTFAGSVESALTQGIRTDGARRVLSITDDAESAGTYTTDFDGPHGPLRPLDFYRRLDRARTFTYATTMDQPLYVEPFREIEPFLYRASEDSAPSAAFPDPTLDGRPAVGLSTMLMNEGAWRTFGLQTAGGDLDWGSVDYERDTIPVVVGEELARVKPVGSTIVSDYYSRRVTLRVTGVLPPHSVIYTDKDPNTSLDRSVVVPYPRQISNAAAGGRHREFYVGVVGNLTHGDLYYDAPTSAAAVEDEVSLASRLSGFTSYVFMRTSNVLMEYRLMRAILEQQRTLVIGIAVIVAGIVLLLMAAARYRLARLRASWLHATWVLGTPRQRILNIVLVGQVAFGAVALAGLVAGVATSDAKGDEGPFFAAIAAMAGLWAIDTAHTLWLTSHAIDAGTLEGDARA